jgi:hypothetical protein
MKHTNFERVEKVQGDVRTEEVIVHRKRRHRHWRLRIWSLVLAVLMWLLLANVYEAKHAPEGEQTCCEPTVEQTVL